MFFEVAQVVSVSMNICLCVDVVLQIQSPFKPASKRAKMYYIFTAAMALWSTIFYFYVNHSTGECVRKPNSHVLETLPKNEVVAELLLLYVFVAIFSMVFAMKKLFRSNYNTEGR
jgi:hypothetical protein